MASPTTITAAQLCRLIGLPDAPVILDGRIDDDLLLDPRMLPGAVRKNLKQASDWAAEFSGKRLVTVCQAPVLSSIDPWALALSAAALLAVFRFKVGMIRTLLACSTAGVVLHLVGAV